MRLIFVDERMTKKAALREVAILRRMNELLFEAMKHTTLPDMMDAFYEQAQLEIDQRIAGFNVVPLKRESLNGRS